MAVAHRFRGSVSLPCLVVESAAFGKESHQRSGLSSRCTLLPKSKNLVTIIPPLESTIHLPHPSPSQFSNFHRVFATRRSTRGQLRASASSLNLHGVFATRRSEGRESRSSASNFHCGFAARRSASAERVFASASSSSAPSSSEATESPKAVTFTFKHVLLPVIDRNPYLSESTRQTIATTATLAKQYGADVTVVVIDRQDSTETRDVQEAKEKHDLQIKTIRWHLSEGGCADYTLVGRLGEVQKPAAVIGEMADDLGLDLVIMSMEAIHHKLVDGNLLGEFVPCPILMLPL